MNFTLRPWNTKDIDSLVKYANNINIAKFMTDKFPNPYTKENAELGYWLAEPFWGKGIITKAIKQIVDFGFKTYDITRIFARPFGTNIASQRVLEKSGFKFECKFEKTLLKNGEMLDELYYSIRRNEK